MYKNLITASLMLCILPDLFAQESVVASGGDASASGGSVSFSIGQIVYQSENSSDGTVSQGVQQAYEVLSVNTQEWDLSYNISLYPNPSVDYLVIEVENADEELTYSIFSQNGEVIGTGKLSGSTTTIKTGTFAPAGYFLTISKKDKSLRQYQFIKID